MRNLILILCILPLACLLLACRSAEGGADGADPQATAGEEAGFVSSLLDRARDMLPETEEEAAAAAAEEAATDKEAIVRCEVNGVVSFTRESQCDNRGGQSLRMALKNR